jgi:DNA replication protein DnaC
MRTVDDVERFDREVEAARKRCGRCQGEDDDCQCAARARLRSAAYAACVPKDFWEWPVVSVTHNVEAFRGVILPYCERLHVARRHGYGLVLLGECGVGKSLFMSMILTRALCCGWSAYYTTTPELDHNTKRAFNDREVARRLDLMLGADFLALDELGKEQHRSGDNHMRVQVERVLKRRFDDSMPTLLAANMDEAGIEQAYGKTIASVIVGKYQHVSLEAGDYRAELREQMKERMGR